jgi:hypothetical protein
MGASRGSLGALDNQEGGLSLLGGWIQNGEAHLDELLERLENVAEADALRVDERDRQVLGARHEDRAGAGLDLLRGMVEKVAKGGVVDLEPDIDDGALNGGGCGSGIRCQGGSVLGGEQGRG